MSWIARDSLASTGAGRPAGATMPNIWSGSFAGEPTSLSEGTSGREGSRLSPVTTSGLSRPPRIRPIEVGTEAKV
ncbi:hypothetical protein D9M68_909780 [compost metagenome]